MKRSVCFMYGSLILVSVASSCLLFILGACEEQRVLLSQQIVNGTETHNWSDPSTPRLSELLRESSVVADDMIPPAAHPGKQQVKAQETTQDRVHSSFVEVMSSLGSSNNEDGVETQGASNIPPEPPTEVGNGLVDTGQPIQLNMNLQDNDSNITEQLTNENASLLERLNQSDDTNNTERYVVLAVPKESDGVVLEDALPVAAEKPVAREAVAEQPVVPPSSALSQPPDDIPSFSEWTQKQMEEAEKKKVHNVSAPVTSANVPLKLRSKNYASPDCGAKIVSANPEAQAPSNVLSTSRDEYLLNPCINRIWFVIELCDSIQAKKLDIANFELFSSSPKDFSVSVSDRFPTRDWRSVGHYTANDDRDVQSYTLQPHLFGKFIKVELHSHYGSEHFCPVSLIRVYGTTEFEVLETEDELHHAAHGLPEHDDEDEAPLIADDPGEPPRNLYGIARDAVKSIVKAAEALVIRTEPVKKLPPNSTVDFPSFTPGHIVVCDNCSETLYNSVFHLLSRHHRDIYSFVQLPFVYDALRSGPICAAYGLDFGRRRPTAYPLRQDPGDYLSSLLPPHYMAALCNALAVMEKKVVLNASQALGNVSMCNVKTEFEGFIGNPATTCSVDTEIKVPPCQSDTVPSNSVTTSQTGENVPVEIKPTKTIQINEMKNDVSIAQTPYEPSTSVEEPRVSTDAGVVEVVPVSLENNNTTVNGTDSDNSSLVNENADEVASVDVADANEEDASLDILLSELKELDSPSSTVLAAMTTTMPPQKESVFVRLSNRIKALERNMSLSGQYLEELSRRYKRQVEEMSRTLNRTLALAESESKKRDDSEKTMVEESVRLRRQLATLEGVVDRLVTERDSWGNKLAVFGQHLLLIVVEMGVFVSVWYACRLWGGDGEEGAERRREEQEERRRSSVDGVSGHRSPVARKKRPSEVALNIKGTYSELLITKPPMSEVEGVWCVPKAEPKRRRRKKKDLFAKCSSNAVLSERKTSMQSQVAVKEISTRRASLSELETISIPSNGVRERWAAEPTPPPSPSRVEELNSSLPLEVPTNESVISVPKQLTKESLDQTLPEALKKNGSVSEANERRLSTASFMKTAVSSRANRRVSEQPPLVAPAKLKSDNWEFWHSSRKSSQVSLAPPVDGQTGGVAEVNGNGTGGSQQNGGRKKTGGGGLKKMVKRFF